MKKLFFYTLLIIGNQNLLLAQDAKTVDPMQDKNLMTWYHKNFATDKIYGVNTQKAYQFFASKGLKPKTVIVGVLDSGIEVDHPGLKKNIWTNAKEISGNGKDDDGNGYVDDVHGWDFIGGKNGDVDVDNMEVTRIVRQYKPIFDGNNSSDNKNNQLKMPEEFKMYMAAKEKFNKNSIEASQNFEFYSKLKTLSPQIIGVLGNKTLTEENLAKIVPTTQLESFAMQILSQLVKDPEAKGKTPPQVELIFAKQIQEGIEEFEIQATKQYNLDFDPRPVVGDNYEDYNQKIYGNNDYEGPDAKHGTHVAGIIAGYPQGKEIQYGIAYKVAKIMSVRTVPNGDERDKDVANAIRYAVDNGAKIINMSFGKSLSPGKKYVWDAIKYAEDKGVLLVHAAGNDNQDLETNENYPTNFKNLTDEKAFVTNMITIGANTNNNEFLRADFSNFNQKMVDVFAPGEQIYSTVPDAKYEYLQGTSMAAPAVAGAAAVLLAYMPNLTPQQIIESLVKTVNKSTVNAMLPVNTNNRFDLISRSGGVIDLGKAAEYAYNNFKITKNLKKK